MKLYLFIFVCCTFAVFTSAQDENNFEEEPAPAPPASSILARARGRALPPKPQVSPKALENNKLKKATPAPPPPPPPAQNDAEPAEENFEGEEEGEFLDENVEASSAKPTEPPKKIGQSARPFRSNQDLLETLKRRREQRVNNPPATTSTTTQFTPVQIPERSKASSRNKFSSSKGNFSPSQEQFFDNSKKSSQSRNSFKNKVSQPPVDETEDTEVTPASKPRAFGGRSRRL